MELTVEKAEQIQSLSKDELKSLIESLKGQTFEEREKNLAVIIDYNVDDELRQGNLLEIMKEFKEDLREMSNRA